MWPLLVKISEHVTKYGSFFGQLWYIFVFLYRLIVVITIGGPVYGDEQAQFKCSQSIVGCQNMCYNLFAKISHMRFWSFQLLAVASPTILFHLYSMHVNGEIAKVKASEKQIEQLQEVNNAGDCTLTSQDLLKFTTKKKQLGNVKIKKVYTDSKLEEIMYTGKLHFAYFVNVVSRMLIEGGSLYLGFLLFQHQSGNDCSDDDISCAKHPMHFLWMKVPGYFKCTNAPGYNIEDACSQHVSLQQLYKGGVPCFIPRPFEKTVFLRYMTVMSALCFVLSAFEILVILGRKLFKQSIGKQRQHAHHKKLSHHSIHDEVFFSPPPSAPVRYHDGNNFYPSLAVPVRISNKEPPTEMKYSAKKGKSADEEKEFSSTASVKSYV